MANFKGGKRKQSEGAKAKFWSLQEPGSEASVSEVAPGVPEPDSRAISQKFLLQKALMLFTAPHRLPKDDEELELGAVLGEGTYGCVCRAMWRHTPVAVKTMCLGSFPNCVLFFPNA